MQLKVMTTAIALAVLPLHMPAHANSAVTRYVGMCDASAAVAIGKSYFVVGDDEQSVLHVYRVDKPVAVTQVDLGTYLGAKKPGVDPGETDIEGAARIGQRIYWIASHGANSKGEPQPGRRRFFATTVTGGAGVPTIRPLTTPPYTQLLDKAIADPRFGTALGQASKLAPESADGLSIEGLAATQDGKLLIGFRNPRPQNKALVLPLHNPAAVLESGMDPVFGDLLELDLGGRGIRSIEWTGKDYLILAGPHDDRTANPGALSFALYRWKGPGSAAPALKTTMPPSVNPETIFKRTDSDRLYVLSDDGDTAVGDKRCKSKKVPLSNKGFRGFFLE